jgi:hypothetical protein
MKFFSPQRFSNFLNSTLLGVTFSRIVGDALMVYKKVSFSTSGVRSNVETFETGKEKKELVPCGWMNHGVYVHVGRENLLYL